jgi:hypothetical protein
VRQLAGMGMTKQGMGVGNATGHWAIEQRRQGQGQYASVLRDTAGRDRGQET